MTDYFTDLYELKCFHVGGMTDCETVQ